MSNLRGRDAINKLTGVANARMAVAQARARSDAEFRALAGTISGGAATRSLNADTRCLDHLRPCRHFLFDECRELPGRAAYRARASARDTLLHLG